MRKGPPPSHGSGIGFTTTRAPSTTFTGTTACCAKPPGKTPSARTGGERRQAGSRYPLSPSAGRIMEGLSLPVGGPLPDTRPRPWPRKDGRRFLPAEGEQPVDHAVVLGVGR